MKYSVKDALSRLAVCLNIAPGIKFSHIDTIVFILLRCEMWEDFFLLFCFFHNIHYICRNFMVI